MDEKQEVDIIALAKKANEALKRVILGENLSGGSAVAAMYTLVQDNAVKDADTARKFASNVSCCIGVFGGREWQEGMQTAPGDFVKYNGYTFIYTGKEPMIHTNPLYYPGAVGVYYWQVIPEMKEGWRIWPDIPDISCSVLQGESWWNVDGTKLYTWNGLDNPNCVWEPSDSVSEWTSKKVEVFG